MSLMNIHNLQCPHCGNKQNAEVWSTVNVSVDPELKTALHEDKINIFDCDKCKKKTFINTPLLYHDMDLAFCVQYYPRHFLDDADFFKQFNPDASTHLTGLPEGMAIAEHLAKPHIVFDMYEFFRYIAFREAIARTTGTKGTDGT